MIAIRELTYPPRDYVKTLNLGEAFVDILAPIVLILILAACFRGNTITGLPSLNAVIINLLAIVVGFSITSITILSASSSKVVVDLQEKLSDRSLEGVKISLFRFLHLGLAYGLFIEIVSLAFNLCISFGITIGYESKLGAWTCVLNAFLICHVIMLNLRNVTHLYFVFWRT